jgi:hypothetical protein
MTHDIPRGGVAAFDVGGERVRVELRDGHIVVWSPDSGIDIVGVTRMGAVVLEIERAVAPPRRVTRH